MALGILGNLKAQIHSGYWCLKEREAEDVQQQLCRCLSGGERMAGEQQDEKGEMEQRKGVLTTPLSDLVFSSIFTAPKPVGFKTHAQ